MRAAEMANALNTILRAEGYQSSVGAGLGGSVVLLALQGVNKVVVFASDEPTLDHVEEWVEALDASRKDSIEEGGVHLRGQEHPGRVARRDPQPDAWRGRARGCAAGAARGPHARGQQRRRAVEAGRTGGSARDRTASTGRRANRRRQEPQHAALPRLRQGVGRNPDGHQAAGPGRSLGTHRGPDCRGSP